MKSKLFVIFIGLLIVFSFCAKKEEMSAKVYLDSLTKVVEPVYKNMNLSYWNATATGKNKYYKEYAKYNLQLKKIFSSKRDFETIKKFKDSKNIKDKILKRTFDILYREFLVNQADTTLLKQISDLSSKVEQKFNTFRGKIDGKPVTGNDIKKILTNSNDLELREKAWEASKQVGDVVANDVLRLVKLRNKLANSLGFDNYFDLALFIQEFDPEKLNRIFNELDEQTRQPFTKLKKELDTYLAKRFGITEGELRPFHYSDPFFQEVPDIYNVNLNELYAERDIITLASKFYESIGMDVSKILSRSDLYEREGKYPHAYCTHIDRRGDVRIMVNVVPSEYWMNTVLHELGHAVYEVYIDSSLPFFLIDPAHSFVTEAVAMFFGRLSKIPGWIKEALNVEDNTINEISKKVRNMLKAEQLIFSRWTQVMYRFERALYRNPDQDLNSLWWELVQKYQMVHPIEGRHKPDWATKIHICSYPVYYHNYMLGEILASQFLYAIMRQEELKNVGDMEFFGNRELGKFFIEKVFKPGKSYKWDELIKIATGEELSPKYFVEEFCK